jgi:ATP-dependent Lon protease
MEILRLPGYLEYEKVAIAKDFLVPKQLIANGLRDSDCSFTTDALRSMINQYTREAGVRNLEREIASVCRKVAKKKAEGKAKRKVIVSEKKIQDFLGVPKYIDSMVEQKARTGIATGLAWTEAGGDVLTVEVSVLPGRGDLLLTGKLGETMRESGQAALSYARSRATILGLEKGFYREVDVHVHVPEGAMPKDGPSAGITMAVALVSALTGVPTRKDVAMTGEITLRGNVLPVGGLNEKLVAARRAGIETVLIPKLNERELKELPVEVRSSLNIVGVETMDEVLQLALDIERDKLYSPKESHQDEAFPAH